MAGQMVSAIRLLDHLSDRLISMGGTRIRGTCTSLLALATNLAHGVMGGRFPISTRYT